jgi:glutathione synthase/RimK-type ligase-like ATP-grasp enzyme
MTDDDLDRLNRVRFCPVQFQEYVPGVDLRVHTIGNRVFAHEIVSDATDYRYASRERASRSMRAAEIPDEIAERCLRLASELGLIMSGVDLRRSYDGEYYCFEINPTPGFYFFEQYTGQRISDALIDLLLRGSVN